MACRVSDRRQLGAQLRELRRRAELTQLQLAERSGYAVRTIRYIESGKDCRLVTIAELLQSVGAGLCIVCADLRS